MRSTNALALFLQSSFRRFRSLHCDSSRSVLQTHACIKRRKSSTGGIALPVSKTLFSTFFLLWDEHSVEGLIKLRHIKSMINWSKFELIHKISCFENWSIKYKWLYVPFLWIKNSNFIKKMKKIDAQYIVESVDQNSQALSTSFSFFCNKNLIDWIFFF